MINSSTVRRRVSLLRCPAHRTVLAVFCPYPANLCPLFCGVEFADFGEDFGHPIGELIETMSGWTVYEPRGRSSSRRLQQRLKLSSITALNEKAVRVLAVGQRD